MKKFDIAAASLIFIGAVNWGTIGLFDFNIVHFFIENTWGDRLIYSMVGFAAFYQLIYRKRFSQNREKGE